MQPKLGAAMQFSTDQKEKRARCQNQPRKWRWDGTPTDLHVNRPG
jgi:hypothetical protein